MATFYLLLKDFYLPKKLSFSKGKWKRVDQTDLTTI